jgi:hypothetical protein
MMLEKSSNFDFGSRRGMLKEKGRAPAVQLSNLKTENLFGRRVDAAEVLEGCGVPPKRRLVTARVLVAASPGVLRIRGVKEKVRMWERSGRDRERVLCGVAHAQRLRQWRIYAISLSHHDTGSGTDTKIGG